MKSKAQQYAEVSKAVEHPFSEVFRVTPEGSLLVNEDQCFTPTEAIRIGQWLLEVFGTPSTVVTDLWAEKISQGFVGKTRDGRRAVYQGYSNHTHVWELVDARLHYDYKTQKYGKEHKSDYDIVSDWTEF